MIIHQTTGCPDHDDCVAATVERATIADVDDDGIVTYRAFCSITDAEWEAGCDEEVSRLILASTLRDYQNGYYLDHKGNRTLDPLE